MSHDSTQLGVILPKEYKTHGIWLSRNGNVGGEDDAHVYMEHDRLVIGRNDHVSKLGFSNPALSISKDGIELQYAGSDGKPVFAKLTNDFVYRSLVNFLEDIKQVVTSSDSTRHEL